MSTRKRVVITGMGVMTPLGHTVPEMFANLLEGKSGVGAITHFPASQFPTSFAAQVHGLDLGQYVPDPGRYEFSGSNTRFALAAAQQALADADLLNTPKFDRSRIGIYLGVGEGAEDFDSVLAACKLSVDASGYKVNYGEITGHLSRLLHGPREAEGEMNTTSAHLADEFDLGGPNSTTLTACAASAQAIGEAAELIRHGDAEVMVAGGTHSMISPFGVTGFNLLTALSTSGAAPQKASRPFDLNRDGFVLGEGSGMLILEELEHAKARGATIYAEFTGYGTTGDAHAMTDPHHGGRGAIRAMKDALRNAGLKPEDIGYINAHGTSTQANDEIETLALKASLGEAAYGIPVSSCKSMLGHLIAAGGAVELIISILAMRQGVLPPTINYETPDPKCDLDYVPNTAREKSGIRHVLSNSFGFGGQNIVLIASRY